MQNYKGRTSAGAVSLFNSFIKYLLNLNAITRMKFVKMVYSKWIVII